MFTAWVDESGSNAALDPGVYMLAAAIAEPGALNDLRGAMQALKLPSQAKVHWHGDSPARHLIVTRTLAALPIESIVVVRVAASDGAERSRRKCLRELLCELHALGCTEVTLESRGPADDRRDMQILDVLRRSRHPAGGIRLYHEVGPKEPMLWIPDAVCGAVTQKRVGEGRYFDLLSNKLTLQVLA